MKDFTIRIYNLPFDYEYGGKEMILQSKIWNFVESNITRYLTETEDAEHFEAIQKEKLWEVVDVTFGKSDFEEENMLEMLDEKDREKKTKIRQV